LKHETQHERRVVLSPVKLGNYQGKRCLTGDNITYYLSTIPAFAQEYALAN
jgi:hypothetical protein